MFLKTTDWVRFFAGTALVWVVFLVGGQAESSSPGILSQTEQVLKTKHFQGFVLYVDLEVDTCSARFSEINAFEKIKEVYPELQYAIVVSRTRQDASYYETWIRDHVFSGYTGEVLVDRDGFFLSQYGLGQGSKLFFFNRKKDLVYVLPMSNSLTGRDYLDIFNDWY